MDIGSDSYFAYEYWNNSFYRSFEHCLGYRISSEVNTGDYKSLRQLRDDYCENWKEKWLRAEKEAVYTDCLNTILNGTNVKLGYLSMWSDQKFEEYTFDSEEVQLMKAFCENAEKKHFNSSGSRGLNAVEAENHHIYENEEDCHLFYRQSVVRYFKIDGDYNSLYDEYKYVDYVMLENFMSNEELNSVIDIFLNLNAKSPWNKKVIMTKVSAHCKDWEKLDTPVKPIYIDEFSGDAIDTEVDQRIFAILTTTWIAAGGLFQFFIVLFLFCCRDSRPQILPKWIRILLLIASPVLLGPFVVHVFGVFFVMKNIKNRSIEMNIQR